jgi:hypothetical protein
MKASSCIITYMERERTSGETTGSTLGIGRIIRWTDKEYSPGSTAESSDFIF